MACSGDTNEGTGRGSFWPLVMIGAVVFWSAAAWLHRYSPFHPQRVRSCAPPSRLQARPVPASQPRPVPRDWVGDFPVRPRPLGLAEGRYPSRLLLLERGPHESPHLP